MSSGVFLHYCNPYTSQSDTVLKPTNAKDQKESGNQRRITAKQQLLVDIYVFDIGSSR